MSNFGFTVAVHPAEGNTAWFVPAIVDQTRTPRDGALVVNRIRDGGHSFVTLRHGLPRSESDGLIYRHGLCVSASGLRLLIGSTTGLLRGIDAGDHWGLAAGHLSPMHAVPFG